MGIFLEHDLMSTETGSHLQGSIVDAGSKVDYQLIIYWLRVALMQKSRYNQPLLLTITQTTSPLMDSDLLQHRHQILICHFPGHDPALQHMHGSLIASHIG